MATAATGQGRTPPAMQESQANEERVAFTQGLCFAFVTEIQT
jgi:hypothetical protein